MKNEEEREMKLWDINLESRGHFERDPANLTVTKYWLERPWDYI